MTVESDVADMYVMILKKYDSEDTAHLAALRLCRELMPAAGDQVVREATARAIASVRIAGAPANDAKPADASQASTKRRSRRLLIC
jgi:hypothetical protein